MSLIRSIILYTALATCANTALADPAALEALKAGDMKKLVVSAEPAEVADTVFYDIEDAEFRLSDWRGKVVLVNFWATWCAPCREEMPSLDRLQAEFGGEDFAVITIATGRNPIPAMKRFFEETGVENLPLYRDPRQALARETAVMGLPVSILLDRQGREVARLMGDAQWDTPEAKAVIEALISE
ncbi:TlpA disulfide reductase family protein [Ostreiculturibacter nitratireducens]|uniref:TlpA disulfide reductase family protein n=1 Tax=Ostreiculturibacter nitratireducens TaxID=3075226 RepID=UPI0031B60C83